MCQHRHLPSMLTGWILGLAAMLVADPAGSLGQDLTNPTLTFDVKNESQRLDMVVNTSRILTLEKKIPQAQVNNPEIVDIRALSANQIQVVAKKPGVTQINIWDENEKVHVIDVIVFGDARELEVTLAHIFPNTSIRVFPLPQSVLLTGYVDDPNVVPRIVDIAQDFHPKVINNITVGGVQQVLLRVKVMEVSRSKLRALGVDFASFVGDDFAVSSVSGLISAFGGGTVTASGSSTFDFGVVDGNSSFFGFLEALRQDNLMKVLAEPNLVTVSGRPAFFNSGGEFPILVPQSLGTVSIEYKKFGTQVDFVPIVLANSAIRLEVRPRVSELDTSQGVTINNITVPALRVREVDTGVELRAGQVLAIAGLVQERYEQEDRGLPFISELPYIGVPFRRVENVTNEVELLILVKPELVDALDMHEVPAGGPGRFTEGPNDNELFFKGYREVPRCCVDGSCANCQERAHQGKEYPSTGPQGSAPPESIPPAGAGGATNLPNPNAGARNPQQGGAILRPASTGQSTQNGSGPGFLGKTGYDVRK